MVIISFRMLINSHKQLPNFLITITHKKTFSVLFGISLKIVLTFTEILLLHKSFGGLGRKAQANSFGDGTQNKQWGHCREWHVYSTMCYLLFLPRTLIEGGAHRTPYIPNNLLLEFAIPALRPLTHHGWKVQTVVFSACKALFLTFRTNNLVKL